MNEYQVESFQVYRQEVLSFEGKVKAALNTHRSATPRSIWMHDEVLALGVEIDAQRIPIQAADWAAWMQNVDMYRSGLSVKFRFENRFRSEYAAQKLMAAIRTHFKGCNVEFLYNQR